MNKSTPNLVDIIVKYDASLQRYARLIIKDPAVATTLVKNVFELVYDENGFAKPQDELRRQLKNYTLTACRYWLQVNASQIAKKK